MLAPRNARLFICSLDAKSVPEPSPFAGSRAGVSSYGHLGTAPAAEPTEASAGESGRRDGHEKLLIEVDGRRAR